MKNKKIQLIAKLLLALPMIIFGGNKFIGFIEVPPPEGETAMLFLGAMFSSYLVKLVGLIDIIGGLFLLIPKTAFIGYLCLLPIIINIVVFHLAHDLPGNGIWIPILLLTIVVGIGFQGKFEELLIKKN